MRLEQIFHQAFVYQKQNQLDQAEKLYLDILEVVPEHHTTLYNLGLIYYCRGDAKKSMLYLQRAIKVKKDYPKAYNAIGDVFKNLGEVEKAIEAYKQALTLKPDYILPMYNLGSCYSIQGILDLAEKQFKQVLKQAPDFALAHNDLGAIYQQREIYEKAEEDYLQAMPFDQTKLTASSNYGNLLNHLNRLEEAIAIYDRVLQEAPSSVEAKFYKGLSLLRLGKLGEGFDRFQECYGLVPSLKELRPFPQLWWRGESLENKTILLWGDLGVGDEYFFSSIIPEIISQAKNCIIEIKERQVALFQRSFPYATVLTSTTPPLPPTQVVHFI